MSMKFDSADRIVLAMALVGFLVAGADARAAEDNPGDWLQRMAIAVRTTNYEGTVIRIQDGAAEAIKVVHVVADGVVREKVIVQEGDGMEIIRNGNEVYCILPDRKSVLVQDWNDQSTLFSTLPTSDIQFGSEYDVAIVREERVAGRKAVMLAIRPHDGFRYGHRLWLDRETGFPLQTNLIAGDGDTIQQVKFADIRIGETIHASALLPSTNIEDFRWFTEPQQTRKQEIDSDWVSNNAPSGFRLISTHAEESPGMGSSTTHMLFSDGLANVSVFIGPHMGDLEVRRARVAQSNSFSIAKDEFRITAVGEVPAETVEQVARSMQPK